MVLVSTTISVVLVDDESLIRTGLRLILGGASDIEVVGEVSDGSAALAEVERSRPDVVLMDIRMPTMDGLTATRELLSRPDPPKVIVLTTFDTDAMVVEALQSGASGFLLKSTHPERLVEAVRAVAAGEPMLSPTVTAQLISRVRSEPGGGTDAQASDRRAAATARLSELTEREREVAIAIGRGASNAEIAATLYMSVATVKAHVSRLLTKLEVGNRTQIALIVHDAGLTD